MRLGNAPRGDGKPVWHYPRSLLLVPPDWHQYALLYAATCWLWGGFAYEMTPSGVSDAPQRTRTPRVTRNMLI